jgi:hypothetical protein
MYRRSYGNVRELTVSDRKYREGQAGYKKPGPFPGSGGKEAEARRRRQNEEGQAASTAERGKRSGAGRTESSRSIAIVPMSGGTWPKGP